MLVIKYNGWNGPGSWPLSKLFEMLATHPLDKSHNDGDCFMTRAHGGEPVYDGLRIVGRVDTGPIYPAHPHAVRFSGTFKTYAHDFCIYTDDAEVIEVLRAAIKENMQRLDYVAQAPNYYREGRLAAARGASLDDTPPDLSTRDARDWNDGWRYARANAAMEAA